jgi:hypothetical protein
MKRKEGEIMIANMQTNLLAALAMFGAGFEGVCVEVV